MEFVLCIRFAFTKIQTARFIAVAQFVTMRNPSSKIVEGKEENCRVAERKRYSRSRAHVLWLGARYSWLPRTVAIDSTVRGFCRLGCSTTAVSGMVGCFGKVMQKLEKRWRLSDEQTHIRQKLNNTHRNAFSVGRPND